MDEKNKDDINKVLEKLDDISRRIQGITLAEYAEMIDSPKRMIWINFVAGLARGLGIAIGATLLAAIFLFILLRLGELNLPLIGKYIARLIKIVQTYL